MNLTYFNWSWVLYKEHNNKNLWANRAKVRAWRVWPITRRTVVSSSRKPSDTTCLIGFSSAKVDRTSVARTPAAQAMIRTTRADTVDKAAIFKWEWRSRLEWRGCLLTCLYKEKGRGRIRWLVKYKVLSVILNTERWWWPRVWLRLHMKDDVLLGPT